MVGSQDSGPTWSRRSFLVAAAAGAVGAAGAGALSRQVLNRDATTDSRPNVLYITADDLGTRLGAYGHEAILTPRIDALALDGVLFERCYCQIALCGPSRASILTGLRPSTTGVLTLNDNWRQASPDAVTLGRHFRNSGYDTFAIGKINDERNGPLDDAWIAQPEKWGVYDTAGARSFMSEVARSAENPWFLAIGFANPHCPWEPSQAASSHYASTPVTSEVGPGRLVRSGYIERCAPDLRANLPTDEIIELTDDEAVTLTRDYLAAITDLDTMVGEIIDHADRLGMRENTIVIFWSGDHGYSLGDNGSWGKWNNHDASTRIPLIMQLPDGSVANARAPGIVEAVDMYPTLVDLCGLGAPPQQLDGISFAPLLREPEQEWKRAAFSQYADRYSVKTARHNLIEDRRTGTVRLYDLEADPRETTNIAESAPALVSELSQILQAGPDAALPA